MFKYILFVLFFITDVVHAQTVRTIGADYIDGNNSGFRNYARNPYFDKNLTGVTCTSFGTCSLTSTEKLQGTQSLSLTSTSASGTAKLRVKAFDRELYGQNCEFSIDVFTSASVVPHYDVYLENNGTQVSGTTTAMVLQTDQTKRYSVQAPCGTASSGPYDLVIDSNNTTGTNIKVDNFYAGLNRNLGNVAQAQWVGAVNYAPITNCAWSVGSATFSNFGADTDCNTATVVGNVVAPGSKIAGFTLTGPPGVYRFVATGNFLNGNAGANCVFRFSDGTNNTQSQGLGITSAAANAYSPVLEGYINYSTGPSAATVQIQAADAAAGLNACQINNQRTNEGFNIAVYYFPTSSQTAVRMDQSNIPWTDYTPGTTQGLGTITARKIKYRRIGQNLEVQATLETGTVTPSEMRFGLPPGLTSAGTTLIPATPGGAGTAEPVGRLIREGFTNAFDTSVLIEPSSTYFTFSISSTSQNGFLKANANAVVGSNEDISFFASIPIAGWADSQNAPLLVGGVTSSYSGVLRTESLGIGGASATTVCSSSPCTLYRNYTVGITVTRSAVGTYVVNFPSGMFSGPPNCSFTGVNAAPNIVSCGNFPTLATATTYPFVCSTPVGPANSDLYGDIICAGPR